MPTTTSSALCRTSSLSSVDSNDSILTTDMTSVLPVDSSTDAAAKRTRKRFTNVQLMMLEHLYHKFSHPTREQREQVAKDADIDIRSVTVWFQNKRQTDRRIHRQLSEPTLQPFGSSACSSKSTLPLPPSSPFSDASGNTIHTVHIRTRTLSGNSTASAPAMSVASTSAAGGESGMNGRKRDRETDVKSRQVRHKVSRHLSLDDVAERSERTGPRPRTPPQSIASSAIRQRAPQPGNAGGGGGGGAEARERALWEGMPSSPTAPNPVPRSERQLIRYGSRRYTLEYACAREMAGMKEREKGHSKFKPDRKEKERELERRHRKHEQKQRNSKTIGTLHGRLVADDDGEHSRVSNRILDQQKKEKEEEGDVPVAEWDTLGDTDTEGALTEAPVTPSSSFGLGELSVVDDEDNIVKVQVAGKVTHLDSRKAESITIETQVVRSAPDVDLIDVAHALCGLSQHR